MADTIVCATRAGEHSRLVHNAAFAEAKESGASIVFLHVIGGEAFEQHNPAMQQAIRDEVGWLVRTLVTLAQQRGRAESVEIRFEFREGSTPAQMVASVQANAATKMIMGDPRNGDESMFDGVMFEDLESAIAEQGAELETVQL